MKNMFKKFVSLTMLLSFSITTPILSLPTMAADWDVPAYNLDSMSAIRESQPSVVSLSAVKGITDKIFEQASAK